MVWEFVRASGAAWDCYSLWLVMLLCQSADSVPQLSEGSGAGGVGSAAGVVQPLLVQLYEPLTQFRCVAEYEGAVTVPVFAGGCRFGTAGPVLEDL